MQNAKSLFSENFNFENMAHLISEISDAKREALDHFSHLKNIHHYEFKGGMINVVDFHTRERLTRGQEPYFTKGNLPTKKEIIEIIEDQIERNNSQWFSIFFESELYCYDSLRDKMEGYDASPTGEWVSIEVLKIKVDNTQKATEEPAAPVKDCGYLEIYDAADPSVGIMPQGWSVMVPFDVKEASKEDLSWFRTQMLSIYRVFAEGKVKALYQFEIEQMEEGGHE